MKLMVKSHDHIQVVAFGPRNHIWSFQKSHKICSLAHHRVWQPLLDDRDRTFRRMVDTQQFCDQCGVEYSAYLASLRLSFWTVSAN